MKIKDFKKFSNLSIECLKELEDLSSVISLKKKETLFLENSEVKNIYFLLEGVISLYKENFNGKRKIIHLINSGNFINEHIIDDFNSSVSCDIFEDSKLLSINISVLKSLFIKYPELSQIFMESMSKKMRRLYRQIKNSGALSMEKKIAAKLWKLSYDYGIVEGEWTKINIKISNILLSEMLGTNRETISRSMQKLYLKRMITYKKPFIYIKRDVLKEFYRS